jgi:hypothetical protein
MQTLDTASLLRRLLQVKSSNEMQKLLESLGDDEALGLEQRFGPHRLKWVPFGDNPSNISTIGLGTKPGKSLTERITNAIDALLEDRAAQESGRTLPESPRLAAQEWFGRPVSGPDAGLFQGLPAPVDRRISVVLLDSGIADCPTVDVIDQGVGILPKDLRSTILSLQAGNKIRKRYQIGAFGQGGSSTLAFSDFVVIVSRSRDDLAAVAFTVIRVMKLDSSYKEDCYAYITHGDGSVLCAQLEGETAELSLYASGARNVPSLPKGTVVRHIGYRLPGLAKALGPGSGNLYTYLHYSLFDPLLPFRVWDLRNSAGDGRNEYVGGSRNRLMSRLSSKTTDDDKEKSEKERIQIKHYRPMEYIVPSGGDAPSIGIEYWVVWAFRKKEEGEEPILRANSAELFVQQNHPIVGTLNGQTQGELTAQLLKEIGLGLLSRHMVVHIDGSAADSRIRRELFATSREGFKEGPVLNSIITSLRRMLEEDEDLARLEAELTERLAKRDTASTREEVRQQVTRLLKEAGLQVSETAKADVAGSGKRQPVVRERRAGYKKRDPLPTLPFPQATFLRFAWPDQHLEVHLQDSELVLIETDADSEFDRRGMLGIVSTDNLLEVESKSNLTGGRIRWRVRPSAKAVVGSVGELRVFLNKLDGVQLSSTITFEVLAARERPAKKGTTVVPPFEIEPISPVETEKWETLWPNDGDDVERQASHAYIAHVHGGKTWVYYSTVFKPFASTLERLKITAPELVATFTTAYEVWIAYHAILQTQAAESSGIDADDDKVADMLDVQRAVVATMQVKQALQYAELWKRATLAAQATG